MAYVTLNHDGVARGSLVRRVIDKHNFTYGSLFEYGQEPEDATKPSWEGKFFCGKCCRDVSNYETYRNN